MLRSILVYCLVLVLTASATGHLRLEITASTACTLRITTAFSSIPLKLTTGSTQATAFHFRSGEHALFVEFSLNEAIGEPNVFELRGPGRVLRKVVQRGDVVVLIQSVYECDWGFYGDRCTETRKPRTPITSTTSTTSTTTTTTTTVSTSTSTTTKATPTTSSAPTSSDDRLITTLWILIAVLTVLTIIAAALLIHQTCCPQTVIHAEIEMMSPAFKLTTNDDKSKMCSDDRRPSLYDAPPRYTALPFESKFTTACEF